MSKLLCFGLQYWSATYGIICLCGLTIRIKCSINVESLEFSHPGFNNMLRIILDHFFDFYMDLNNQYIRIYIIVFLHVSCFEIHNYQY